MTFKKSKSTAKYVSLGVKAQSFYNSHLTSGSEPEGLLRVEESSPKSVLLRTEVIRGRIHLTYVRHLQEQRSASWCVMLNSLEWWWEKWALPGWDSPYPMVEVVNSWMTFTVYTQFLWPPELGDLVTWQMCWLYFAFSDFLLPPNGAMWGWSCPSLNANTAWVACYCVITVSFYHQYCSLPRQFPLLSPS